MKNIWILGASGMLGSHFERLLKSNNSSFMGQEAERIDITDLNALRQFVQKHAITHIINCAAYTQVDKAESEAERAFQVNAIGPENLGIISKESGVKIIHFSTDYVFNGESATPYEEEHPCAPINAYGFSKWEGEKRLLKHAPNACVIRISWLFGHPGKNFVSTMLKLMREKEILRIVSDQFGCPTYCQDLAETTLKLLDHAGIFHYCNSSPTSWYHFANEIYHIARAYGMPLAVKSIEPIPTEQYPTPAKRPAYSTLNTKKLETLLQEKPRPWQEALKEYIIQYHGQLQPTEPLI